MTVYSIRMEIKNSIVVVSMDVKPFQLHQSSEHQIILVQTANKKRLLDVRTRHDITWAFPMANSNQDILCSDHKQLPILQIPRTKLCPVIAYNLIDQKTPHIAMQSSNTDKDGGAGRGGVRLV